MKNILFCLIMIAFTSCASGQPEKGFRVEVGISGLRDSSIYLAYHLGDKQYVTDTITLDSNGNGVFSGQESLPQGIYLIVLPGKQYFEILMGVDQNFSLTCSIADYFHTLEFKGSDENNAFVAYQRDWVGLQLKANGLVKRIQANKQNADSVRILTASQKAQEAVMKAYLNKVIDRNKGTLLAVLVKAMLPVDMPVITAPPGSRNPDSVKWVMTYLHNKDHFFDNTDLSDERLLRTPILQARLNSFFTNVLIQAPDTIDREIDRLIAKVQGDPKLFQFVAVWLFNHFSQSEVMGHDAVMVKLADDIYLSGKAPWVSKEFRDDLRKQVELIRPNLIGKKAVDLVMDSYKGIFVSLYDVDKDFTILYFWEPDCSHCKEATPKLRKYYETAKNEGVEVFAVCTTADRQKWEKYIQDNDLSWINGWDPDRKSNFGAYYNVQSTPLIYILDRNKKIIAKKLSVDDIPLFISNYRKFFRK
ncbi:MAG: thioredoxin-like domain-containing protein [Bacteroidales bacterium]